MEIEYRACGGEMQLQKSSLMELDVSTWVCAECGEEVYDFSGKGESCMTCSACDACLWR